MYVLLRVEVKVWSRNRALESLLSGIDQPTVNIRSGMLIGVIPVLWIRIRKDPKLFAGSGSVTRGYGSGFGSETGLKSY
jgi:hypothetical protein